jgi:hypothetical protein
MARFDAPFSARYGVSLDTLAHRYDDLAARQRGALDTARSLSEQALDQVASVRGGVSHLESHILRLDARLGEAEARADAMGQKVVDLMSSTSWRVTAPLRAVSARLLQLRQGTALAAVKGRARAVPRRLGQAVLRNRAAKDLVRQLLRPFPRLQARVRTMMEQSPLSQSGPPPASQHVRDLSPRGQQLYAELKQAIEEKDA